MSRKAAGHVTLKNIAEELNLSVNTVSCALKGRSNNISAQTVQRIQKKAKEMGYIPNSIASSMRTGKTDTIAIVLGDIANPYFSIMVKELERYIRAKNCATIILVTDENAELEYRAIQTAISKNVDGIILFPTCETMDGIQLMRKAGIPFVLLGRRMPDNQMDFIVSDDIHGGYLATKYLIERGHRDILFFTGPDYMSCAKERRLGYEKACQEAGIEVIPERVISCGVMIPPEQNDYIFHILMHRERYTAIFTYNDIIAFRVMKLLRKQKENLPDIVGYDDIQSQIDFGYEFPSVNINKGYMAERAVEVLFERIYSETSPVKYYNEIVPVQLKN